MKKLFAFLLSMIMLTGMVACQSTTTNSRIQGDSDQQSDHRFAEPEMSDNSESGRSELTEDQHRLSIVTTIFPQYDFTRNIAGDRADVTLLLKPGAESHSYEPTPQDIKTIQESDLFIITGGENDTWVESMIESMGDQAPEVMRLVDLVDTFTEETVEGMEDSHDHGETSDLGGDEAGHDHENDHHGEDHHRETDDHDHSSHTVDEHVWTSPVKAEQIVEKIAAKLSEKDSANKDFYQANSEDYIAKLGELDHKYRNMIHSAKRDTILVADRFPFRYLAEEYGLKYYAAFTGCSTETEASAATVAFLIDKTKELESPVVFSIELSNQKIADSIVETTGAEKLTLHSAHNLSVEELKNGATYLSLMEQNLKNLEKALQ